MNDVHAHQEFTLNIFSTYESMPRKYQVVRQQHSLYAKGNKEYGL